MKSSGVDTEVLYLHIKVLSPCHYEAELLGGQWCALNALLCVCGVVCIECFAVAKKPS